jgi:hypothetical protein
MTKKILYLIGGILLFVFGMVIVVGSVKQYNPMGDMLLGSTFALTGFFVSLIQSISLGILISKK